MRGEHETTQDVDWVNKGSSPHARGTRDLCRSGGRFGGIIPACAGNTLRPFKQGMQWGDHPRMRGEHALMPLTGLQIPGSSPHAR